jgi:NADPH-dependent stearoyl-CoA 9-desaturase
VVVGSRSRQLRPSKVLVAITDIAAYAHLTESDIEQLATEFDAIRSDIERSRGQRDADYIRRAIALQRGLEVAARITLLASGRRAGWVAGTGLLAAAKIIEMMELGHNISHGQWDWMNDPEIHSTTWEWDFLGPSSHWKRAHNHVHHTYTNVYGMDEDLGFAALRMTRDEPWRPIHLLQPITNLLIALTFEPSIAVHDWAIARHHVDSHRQQRLVKADKEFARKAIRQLAKDLLLFPALSGRRFIRTLIANLAAATLRNLWSYVVIFCGHFPDGAEKFTLDALATETRSQWYLRQLLGSANFSAGPLLAFLSGNLCYQIEHHLFPDLPSNRYPEIAARVRQLCDRYDLPYTSGPLHRQYLLSLRTVLKLALPNRFLRRTSHDAPETSSERRFLNQSRPPGLDSKRGLRTAQQAT